MFFPLASCHGYWDLRCERVKGLCLKNSAFFHLLPPGWSLTHGRLEEGNDGDARYSGAPVARSSKIHSRLMPGTKA